MTGIARSRPVTGATPAADTESSRFHRAFVSVRAWFAALDEFERVFYTGLTLTAIGLVLWMPPLAFIVPGLTLSAVALLLRLRGS